MSEKSAPKADATAGADESAARLFDIRRIIGGLFVLYGVIVTLAGVFDGPPAKNQAGGIDINLWTGLGMLCLGAFFLVWMRLSPVEPPTPPRQASDAQEAASGR